MASNTLTGTTGNDILNAPGSVVTQVSGAQGNDTITLVLEDDIAQAGKGDDSILINVDGNSSSTAYGGEGADTITLGTAVLTNAAYVQAGAGNDSVNLGGGASFTVFNGAFIGGNAGNDTLTVTGAATLATIGGGQGADEILLQAGATSAGIRGGKGKDSLTLNGTITGSTVSGNEGNDTISATGLTGTTSLVGGGKGNDSISINTGAIATLVGGYLNDTITGLGSYTGGVIYADANGQKTGGSGSGASADGADLISFTAATIAEGTTIYGAGGNDTITTNGTSSNDSSLLIDGGNGADVIGTSATYFSGLATTIAGGAGHDTIKMLNGGSALVLGGAGNDSITFGALSALYGSINGGAGDDTITLLNKDSFASQMIVQTINGGAGSDVINLGSYTAGVVADDAISAAVIGNVVYGSGDKIVMDATNAVSDSANWLGATQVYIADNLASANLNSVIDGLTQAGSVLVFESGDDLVIGITGEAGAAGYSTVAIINVIGGADAIKTTALGAQTLNSDNFGFTIATTNNDLSITFT